ncbi:hypothetical protein BDR05DRAFT_969576 [Suillus weaverae]|nr:hypothetical protein BDR05DRAFT_969576 [Suillus weaverae]
MSRVRKQEAGQCLRRVGGARDTVDGGESDMESSRVESAAWLAVPVLQTESQANGRSGARGYLCNTVDSSSNKNHWRMRWC